MCFPLLVQIKYNEIPINRNKNIHTGANNQFGGLKLGFTKVGYQVDIETMLNKDPIPPANWQITNAIISFRMFFIILILFYLFLNVCLELRPQCLKILDY